jgi:hypothetical protein
MEEEVEESGGERENLGRYRTEVREKRMREAISQEWRV